MANAPGVIYFDVEPVLGRDFKATLETLRQHAAAAEDANRSLKEALDMLITLRSKDDTEMVGASDA